ncbi:MAG: LysR substrate-binding domain-containing protein [Pseudomonadota bacterium]
MTPLARIRLRHVRVFLEVARVGGLTAAAGTLHVTQPALSKTIRELEEIVGAALFDRSHRQMILNDAGRRFHAHAARIERDLDRATRAAQRAAKRSRLRLGVLPTAATDLVPRAVRRFSQTRPNCVLDVATGGNPDLVGALRGGALDLVVGRMAPPEAMTGLAFEQLYPERILAVARPDHPLAELEVVEATRLESWPLILPPPDALIAQPVEAWRLSVGLSHVEATLRTVSLAVGRGAVRGSDGVWFISEGVVAFELRERLLAALPLDRPIYAGPLGISRRAEDDGEEAAAFADCLHAVAQHMRAGG